METTKKRKGRLPNDGREYKTCLDCKEEFPYTDFPTAMSHGYRIYKSRCRPCYNMYSMNKPKRDCTINYPSEKVCSDCKVLKPLDQYFSMGRGYYRSMCKPCYNERQKVLKAPYREKYNALDRVGKAQIRLDAIEAYGGKCVCCGESEEMFMTFDHVYDDGQAHRKVVGTGVRFYRWLRNNDYPDTIQLLCWNCNWAKSRRGGCPHQKI